MLNKTLSFGSILVALYLCTLLPSGVVIATPSAEAPNSQPPTAKSAKSQTPTSTPQPPTSSSITPASSTIAGCPLFPADNVWNARVDWLPVDSRSNAYINSIGPSIGLHADFGSGEWEGGPIGIPYTITTGSQLSVTITEGRLQHNACAGLCIRALI